ncbi:MAG: polyprenyl synthetase family protein [Chloroflexi bacterium]|nr:polyprenyl synthetase family protein [Chloroflexota bacterium]
MADGKLQTGDYLQAVDSMLRALVVSPGPAYDTYYGMFRYHLGWTDINFVETKTDSGKRIRPLLCLVSCEAVGGDWRPALPVAVAIELVHNFSLIHDDIEDQSDERRGRTAVWKAWGLAQGLNAGDGMFMLARLALDRLSQHGVAPDKCTRINLEFDATTLELCHGQYLDLGFESRLDVTVDEYIQMIRGKTAALISSATRIGAMLATDDVRTIDALSRFGENIGLAFQVTDDILGIWGDPSVTGKSAATDILSRKKSLPAILGLSDRVVGPSLQEIYRLPQLESSHVTRVLELLDAVDARRLAQHRADQYRSAGLQALDESGLDNPAVRLLRDIADAMTRRQK